MYSHLIIWMIKGCMILHRLMSSSRSIMLSHMESLWEMYFRNVPLISSVRRLYQHTPLERLRWHSCHIYITKHQQIWFWSYQKLILHFHILPVLNFPPWWPCLYNFQWYCYHIVTFQLSHDVHAFSLLS